MLSLRFRKNVAALLATAGFISASSCSAEENNIESTSRASTSQLPPETTSPITVRGSGAINAPYEQLGQDPNWNPVPSDLFSATMPQIGDECIPGRTVNTPLSDEQADRLNRFLRGEWIDRIDPNKNDEHSRMMDKFVGSVCTKDGRQSILYSAQGRYMVTGEGSLEDPNPFGPNIYESGGHVLLQGRVTAGVINKDEKSPPALILTGSDGGVFVVPGTGSPKYGPECRDTVQTLKGELSAVIATEHNVLAVFVNMHGKGPSYYPDSSAPLRPAQQRVVICAPEGAPAGGADKLLKAVNSIAEGRSLEDAGLKMEP